jgi:hypothetical protein
MAIKFSTAKAAERLERGDLVAIDADGTVSKAATGDVCPACGHRLKPLTNAERQKRYRERKKHEQRRSTPSPRRP